MAFWCNAISGLLLFAAETSKMASFPVFWIKIAFIVAGVLVMRALRNLLFDDAALAGCGKEHRLLAAGSGDLRHTRKGCFAR